jgi:membrane fusion protein (multidrug efflux system)
MMMRVSIARGQRQAISAPESAISMQGDKAFVFVVARQGDRTVAEQRPVVTGARSDGFVELREGVRAGETLIADGLNKITAGQAVTVGGAGRPNGAGPAKARAPSA